MWAFIACLAVSTVCLAVCVAVQARILSGLVRTLAGREAFPEPEPRKGKRTHFSMYKDKEFHPEEDD
jgi:hypothetical protein